MKREIKFRAWIERLNKMEDVISLEWLYNEITEKHDIIDIVTRSMRLSDLPILMEYTNLKDRNGKEIYEGDILKCVDGAIQEVYFHNEGAFVARDIKTDDTLEDMWMIEDDDEVIGNIYENPELL